MVFSEPIRDLGQQGMSPYSNRSAISSHPVYPNKFSAVTKLVGDTYQFTPLNPLLMALSLSKGVLSSYLGIFCKPLRVLLLGCVSSIEENIEIVGPEVEVEGRDRLSPIAVVVVAMKICVKNSLLSLCEGSRLHRGEDGSATSGASGPSELHGGGADKGYATGESRPIRLSLKQSIKIKG